MDDFLTFLVRVLRETETEELVEEMLQLVEPVLKAADQAMEELDYAAVLPDLEDGAVDRFHSAIAKSSKQLRETLKAAVGPATLKGVRKNVELVWDAISKSEELRRRGWLEKNKHAIAGSLGVENLKSSLAATAKMKAVFEAAGRSMGFDAKKLISDENWGHAAAKLAMVEAGKIYASAAGLEAVDQQALTGKQLLGPGKEDEDDTVEGGWREVRNVTPASDGRETTEELLDEEAIDGE